MQSTPSNAVHWTVLGIDDFLDHVTVLPPGEWDPKTRIEPPKSVPNKVGVRSRLECRSHRFATQEDRLDRTKINGVTSMGQPEHPEHELDPSLIRTGRYAREGRRRARSACVD